MGELFSWPPSWATLLLLPALLVGFTVHELAHALVAFLLGDTSQVERKRLSLNPLRHVSWIGMLAFLLVGVGWAKPVWVDQARLRTANRAFGMFLISIAGAAANLLTALVALLGMLTTVTLVVALSGAPLLDVVQFLLVEDPTLDAQGLAVAFTTYMILVNLLLAFFNMLPLPPLDGFQAAMSLYALIRSAIRPDSSAQQASSLETTGAGADEPEQTPAQIHFEIGFDYHQDNQLDEAIARYRQAVAHDANYAEAYYNQGLAYWAKGRSSLASSAFQAAIRCEGNPTVRSQAGLRLHELALAQQDPERELGPAPEPLQPGTAMRSGDAPSYRAPALDPDVARRMWLRLALGGVAILFGSLALWLFVTITTLGSVM
jgi:Zn-dependent protease